MVYDLRSQFLFQAYSIFNVQNVFQFVWKGVRASMEDPKESQITLDTRDSVSMTEPASHQRHAESPFHTTNLPDTHKETCAHNSVQLECNIHSGVVIHAWYLLTVSTG